MESRWLEKTLITPDGRLLLAEQGDGSPLLFLHGGPGDEYRYLRALADPLTDAFRCILYDQRGSGGSTLNELSRTTLHPDRFVEDIEQIRDHLGQRKIRLVGHSWGANLALLYGAARPERVERIVLIGLGPLNEEMAQVAKSNRLRHLTPAERQEHATLSRQRQEAIESGDAERLVRINRRRFRLAAPGQFYRLEDVKAVVDEWLAFEPYRNWRVNRLVNQLVDQQAMWQRLPRLTAPVLVLYGYQDFEPITQAYLLKEHLADARPLFINECGHLPWLERPEAVTEALLKFLDAAAA